MKLRKETSNLLRQFNSLHKLNGENRVSLQTIDAFGHLVSHSGNNVHKDVVSHYREEFFLVNLFLISFGALVLASKRDSSKAECKNIILKETFSGLDIDLRAFITNICNTASASINLIKQGYDTQARVLLRTLEERIYQCIVLFSSSEDYEKWRSAQDQEEAKGVHYDLFAKKGRLLKRVSELEKQYLGMSDHDGEVKIWRKERESYYSMAVHGASSIVLLGSAAFSLEDDQVYEPNLFGIFSTSASFGTLSHMLLQLRGLALLLPLILEDVHGWVPNIENEYEKIYQVTNDIGLALTQEWLREKCTTEKNY